MADRSRSNLAITAISRGKSPRPGSDLTDLMYGTALNGTRENISALDLAILADTGLPMTGLNEFVVHNFGTNATVSTANGFDTVNYGIAAAGVIASLTTGIGTDGAGGTDLLIGLKNKRVGPWRHSDRQFAGE